MSVIITSYNHGEFLNEAIDSVLNQSSLPSEVIVVDDGSMDSSADVIRGYGNRITSRIASKNLGGPENLNQGIELSSQPYLAILNSDDVWEPQKLAKQFEYMTSKNLDAVFTTAKIIDESSRTLSSPPSYFDLFQKHEPEFKDFLTHFFYKGNFLCHSSVLASRDLFSTCGLYDNRFRQLPDFHMWIRFAKHGNIEILGDNLVKYRYLGERNTSTLGSEDVLVRTRFEHLQVFLEFFDGLSEEEIASRFAGFPGAAEAPNNQGLRIASRLLLSHPDYSLRKPAEVAGLLLAWGDANPRGTHRELQRMTASADVFSLKGPLNVAREKVGILRGLSSKFMHGSKI